MRRALFLIMLIALLPSCSKSKELKVMATPTPQAELLEFARPELERLGYAMEIIAVEDYNLPNRALAEGEIAANFFQHIPFLHEQIHQFRYPIASFAKVEIEPMGIYSSQYRSVLDFPIKIKIAIPNDPTNEARALLLLASEGLIELDSSSNLLATPANITKNPKEIELIEIDPAMLPRALGEVGAALINANYALQAGLNPLKDALALENRDSPYVNVIAICIGDEERPDLQALKEVMTSDKMRTHILETYRGAILPAF